MGVVWRAERVSDGAPAAIKLISPNDGSFGDSGAAARFRVEIAAMRRIAHPGVVRVLDHGSHEGAPWYAMEVVPGQPMGDAMAPRRDTSPTTATPLALDVTIAEIAEKTSRIFEQNTDVVAVYESAAWHHALDEAREASDVASAPTTSIAPAEDDPDTRPLPDASSPDTRRALGWLGQVCETLTYLHGEGWIHRDLKPDNIMIRPDGRALLLDFGLASRSDGRLGRDAIRDAGLRMGTLSYIAPEQIEGQLVDARADLYSIGCILYEILTGRPPFEADSALALMMKHAASPHVEVTSRARNVPTWIAALVDTLLAKNPSDRPGNSAVVAQTLRRAGIEIPTWDDAPPSRAHLYTAEYAGREHEIAALESLRKIASRGKGAVAWIGGESGSGKTRLVREIAKRARQREAIVLTGQCDQVDATLEQSSFASPLHALLGPLRAIADECIQRGEAYTQWVFAHDRAARLVPFAPFLMHVPGAAFSGFASLTGAKARQRIREAAREVFEAFVDLQPFALILDDLQWADEFSLEVVGDLIDVSSPERRWMIVGTYRLEEVHPGLDAVLSIPRARQEHLTLEALGDDAVTRIVSGMLGVAEAEPVLGSFIARRSGGNPFFVAEYLRLLVEADFLRHNARGVWALADSSSDTHARLSSLPAPSSVVALAADRLGRLDEASRALAAAVALVGKSAPLEVAAALCRLEASRVAAATHELERARIIETDGLTLRFTHDKLREASYAILPASSRPALHARAAALMEGSGATAAELARHLDLAGDRASAHARYIEAAEEASSMHPFRAAERHARRSIELSAPGTHEDVLARIALARHVYFKESRYLEMFEALRGLEEVAARVSTTETRMTLATALGEALRLTGSPVEGLAMLERARDLFMEQPDEIESGSRVMNNLGIAYQGRGMLDEAAACYRFVLNMRDGIQPFVAASMLSNLGVVELRLGHADVALRCYEEALVIHERIGNPRSVAITLGNLSALYLALGRVDDALTYGERGLLLRRSSGDLRGTSQNLRGLSRALLAAGRVEHAREYTEEAISQVHLVSSQRQLANCFCALGEVLLAEHRYSDALIPFDRSVEMARRSGDFNLNSLILIFRALTHVRLGDTAAAHRDLDEALEVMPDERRLRGFHDLTRAEAHLSEGEPLLAAFRSRDAIASFETSQRWLDVLDGYTVLLRALTASGHDPSLTIRLADAIHARFEGRGALAARDYSAARSDALAARS